MFSNQDELVIPMSRLKLLGLLAGSAVFVLLGWLMLTTPGRRDTVMRKVGGAAAVAFFGSIGVAVLYRLVSGGPALVINRDGILDNASGTAVGLIRWHEIEAVRPYEVNGRTFLAIVPKDLDAVLSRLPAWKRKLLRANLAIGADAINIPDVTLPMSVADLEREIQARFKVGR